MAIRRYTGSEDLKAMNVRLDPAVHQALLTDSQTTHTSMSSIVNNVLMVHYNLTPTATWTSSYVTSTAANTSISPEVLQANVANHTYVSSRSALDAIIDKLGGD